MKAAKNQKSLSYTIGMTLLVLSCLLWVSLLAIPLLKIPVASQGVVAASILIIAEIIFWIGTLLIGKEAYAKLKSRIKGTAKK